ncbi:MAG: hypothetical protein NY202_00540 [Mollicutes bacterium UO1]
MNDSPLSLMPINSGLEFKIISASSELDDLTTTSNASYEISRINDFIRQAESNRSYNRSKYQIEQEKFQERIEVYPKDWRRIS